MILTTRRCFYLYSRCTLITSNSFVATKFYAEPDDICDPVILFTPAMG